MSVLIVNTDTGKVFSELRRSGPLSDVTSRWIGKCKKCGKTHKLEGKLMIGRIGAANSDESSISHDAIAMPDGTAYVADSSQYVRVRCGDHWCRLRRVFEGTKKSKHECGARCTNATGPNCDCRCKGKNHGSNC